ncbi:solute carrier family 39 (zinc transporter), member 11 [Mytilus galloprovincialis]|uniref:Zinc transporter ZIP11 n=1 Tax=Mytilus galloprovincialis TaxID=29158 RepID=A0A8B6EEY5_MYTGA|nr:solute carrier family 39 (zinc transporter), member 11 [Mytilus galloprovincialis]
MIAGQNAIFQTFLGTLFTWGLTALGAALVFVFNSRQRKVLDASLGFAAGVMTAASYWSLLAPAIEMAELSGLYGSNGEWAFIPVAVGFVLGAVFVYGADVLIPYIGGGGNNIIMSLESEYKQHKDEDVQINLVSQEQSYNYSRSEYSTGPQRRKPVQGGLISTEDQNNVVNKCLLSIIIQNTKLCEKHITTYHCITVHNIPYIHQVLLLIIAITVHNIPEGLAVGVGFGAVGRTPSATFEKARNLAVGIGIQNFPEGLAVSLPLRGAGMSTLKSFWYGQLSGMVEPIAGLFGAIAVVIAQPLLPYALAFAAGAMIYVVVDDIIPEAQTCGNGKVASWGAVVGFVVMMSLDVGLG